MEQYNMQRLVFHFIFTFLTAPLVVSPATESKTGTGRPIVFI